MKKIVLFVLLGVLAFSTAMALPIFKGFEKLDLHTKQLVKSAKEGADEVLEAIIKANCTIKNKQKKLLKKAGFEYRSVFNQMATGSIRLSKLHKLAGLDFVEYIEGAIALGEKKVD